MTAAREKKIAFGDFQTPVELAVEVCSLLKRLGISPAAVIEPTCGRGAFLAAASAVFPSARTVGYEVNPDWVAEAKDALAGKGVEINLGDFFAVDWREVVSGLPEPLLVVGNPPWVTNAALGAIGSDNLPAKSNFQAHKGMDAITGKSNFDISEWMLLRAFDWFVGRTGTLAVLCKASVARKLLAAAWQKNSAVTWAQIHLIDAKKHFGASVEACLLVCEFGTVPGKQVCEVFSSIGGPRLETLGYKNGQLIANVSAYERWAHLAGVTEIKWRSGIKHDCSPVMELVEDQAGLTNGLGEFVVVEPDFLFPMLKTSDLGKETAKCPVRWMIVTQTSVGENTEKIRTEAPKTWRYLTAHAEMFDRRKSVIYRNKPDFSIFGVGSYSFAPWKVAISGFYKSLTFKVLGPRDGKPLVLDDLSYFLPCKNQSEAEQLARALNSEQARGFYESLIFWDSKRPITVSLLSRLSLERLGAVLGEDLLSNRAEVLPLLLQTK